MLPSRSCGGCGGLLLLMVRRETRYVSSRETTAKSGIDVLSVMAAGQSGGETCRQVFFISCT
jgi:hypothetical protein